MASVVDGRRAAGGMQAAGEGVPSTRLHLWLGRTSSLPCQVSFIMPSQYTKETLPKPGGSGVHVADRGPRFHEQRGDSAAWARGAAQDRTCAACFLSCWLPPCKQA